MAARVVAPFQYPGSKHRVAPLVWQALGDPVRYVEPFAGSLGVLLARPGQHDGYNEVVNDADGFIVNVWRAIRYASDEVAWWLDGPASAADLAARYRWMHTDGIKRVAPVFTDPCHYDIQAAAWFIYGLAFSAHPSAFMNTNKSTPGRPNKSPGAGPHAEHRQPIDAYLRKVAARIRRATLHAGDWTKSTTTTVLFNHPSDLVGVFLDPPYGTDRIAGLYGVDSFSTAVDVLAWCVANGGNRKLRIVLAGYDKEHNHLEDYGWRVTAWSSQTGGPSRHSERLWFSPHCLAAGSADGVLSLEAV